MLPRLLRRFSCPYNARCIRTKRILAARRGRRGERAERHVDVRQFDAHAIRQICRTASDSLLQNVYPTPLSLSLLPFVARSFPLSSLSSIEGRKESEKWNVENLSRGDGKIRQHDRHGSSNERMEDWGWMERRFLKKRER